MPRAMTLDDRLLYGKKRGGRMPSPFLCDSAWIRTKDPLIKSQMLCQLSYGIAGVSVSRHRPPNYEHRVGPTK